MTTPACNILFCPTKQVPFLVWSDSQPAVNATVTRSLVVAPPCTRGLYACPSGGGGTGVVCSAIPCSLLSTLAGQQQGPVLRFVQQFAAPPPPPPPAAGSRAPPPPPPSTQPPPQSQEQVVVMSYGQPPQQSLLPCGSAAEAAGGGCRAVAYDASVSGAWQWLGV